MHNIERREHGIGFGTIPLLVNGFPIKTIQIHFPMNESEGHCSSHFFTRLILSFLRISLLDFSPVNFSLQQQAFQYCPFMSTGT